MGSASPPPEQLHRESAVIRHLRQVSVWSLFAGAFAFAFVFGLGLGVVVAAAFAVVSAVVYRGSQVVFGERIKERFKRQPNLRLAVSHDGRYVDAVASKVLSPWPFDAERVVFNELARLQAHADTRETFARKGPTTIVPFSVDPFMRRPSDQDYRRAREEFTERVDEYKRALWAWLAEYREAAGQRAGMFELSLSIISAKSSAYAEDVTLTIDLPEGVEVVEEWPTVSPPPEPPAYVAPQPQSAFDGRRLSYPKIDLNALMPVMPVVSRADVSVWQTRGDGRRVERRLGNIHHDSTVELDEPLLLRVATDGHHTLTWTVRAKNGFRHRTDVLELFVPSAGQRPPFTRLRGIESYPDVPLVDEDGQVVCQARTNDPPTEPPPQDDELRGQLRGIVARREWLALGLGDNVDDGDDEKAIIGATDSERDAA